MFDFNFYDVGMEFGDFWKFFYVVVKISFLDFDEGLKRRMFWLGV